MTLRSPEAMPRKDHREPKQRILEAATELFARKGYDATGVREIASSAGVNLAMISYYYGSKRGVLKAIVSATMERLRGMVEQTLGADLPLEQGLRTYFTRLIQLVRDHQPMFRIFVAQLHHDTPEMSEFKADLIREHLFPFLTGFIKRHQDQMHPDLVPEALAPILPGMVLYHFLVAPVFSRIIQRELDDDFYTLLADQLTHLVLHGIQGPGGKTSAHGARSK
jgi:AcrR family transcriptional regulator